MLDWFDTSEVDTFADKLVQELKERLPPQDFALQGKKEMNRRAKTRSVILRQAQDFTRTHSMNIYKKARLANRFKWALREAGYSKGIVDDIAYELAAVMATSRRSA